MNKIKEIIEREIKDSRGKPTVEVELITEKGRFIASCPSGASTGKNEALELRDEDGRGVSKAIANVNKIIAKKLVGKDPINQKELDEMMIALDGTENKSKLGANAILPVSMAICRAGAAAEKLPLYKYIAKISGNSSKKIPFAGFNFIEGGAHAIGRNNLDLQEFMVVPHKKTFAENIMIANKKFSNLQRIIKESYGENVEMGDEGGFTPKISRAEQALFLLKNAITEGDTKIAIDVAASEFYKNGKYILEGKEISRKELLDFYKNLVLRFPIISIEDPFAEEDWEGFKEITKELPDTIVVGDDLTTTNIKKIKEAHSKNACSGVIIKVNQIGTVSKTI